jgi:Chlamydia CHLPS protein (DUF818)
MLCTSSYHKIYDDFFSLNEKKIGLDWQKFTASKGEVDFRLIQNRVLPPTWIETLKKTAYLVLTVVLFPLGIVRYVATRLVMSMVYPAQSYLLRSINAEKLEAVWKEKIQREQKKAIIREVVFEKDGVQYKGMLYGHHDHILNGKWVLQALGNHDTYETTGLGFARVYEQIGFNTLILNAPSVGKSAGEATPYSMGEVQELGLRFLEKAIRAKRIVAAGYQIGGIAIGQAILQHSFPKDLRYFVVSQMTSDRFSHEVGQRAYKIWSGFSLSWLGKVHEMILRYAIQWKCLNLEADSIEAARKLKKLKFVQTIIEANYRYVQCKIPNLGNFTLTPNTLLHGLCQTKIIKGKVIVGIDCTNTKMVGTKILQNTRAVISSWDSKQNSRS